MQKKRLRTLGMAIVISTMCIGSMNVYAGETAYIVDANGNSVAIAPFFTTLVGCFSNLTLNSGGKLTCEASTETQANYKAGLTVELQQNKGSWTTIKTWSDSSTSKFVGLEKDWYVENGYSYRLKVTHTAKNSSGTVVESSINYSTTVVYK